ncbi:MAG: cyclic nucleotide-binding domain-containing protein [Verrucomicrobiota bacterium]
MAIWSAAMGNFFSRKNELPEVLAALSKVELFSELTNRELKILEPIIHERLFVPDEIVFEEEQEGLGMYLVLEGKIQIVRTKGKKLEEIATLEPGNYFGELALLDGAPRSATAIALESSRLAGFFRPEFFEIMETHGRLGAKISLSLARLTGRRFRNALADKLNCTSL